MNYPNNGLNTLHFTNSFCLLQLPLPREQGQANCIWSQRKGGRATAALKILYCKNAEHCTFGRRCGRPHQATRYNSPFELHIKAMPIGTGQPTTSSVASRINKYYLLVIGIDIYPPGFNNLNNAVSDAQRVADKLRGKYRFDFFYSLYDQEGKRENILQQISEIYDLLGPDDALMIYFAGHGIYSKKNNGYYLVTSDSRIKDLQPGGNLDISLLSLSSVCNQFQDYPESKKCRHLLLVIDACYAGSALRGNRGGQQDDFFSRIILTSTLHDQKAEDGIKERGSAFANAFISTLEQNEQNSLPLYSLLVTLESKFDASGEKLFDEQQLSFGDPPNTQSGHGSFVFEKKEQEKPNIVYLKNSLIHHLDFNKQRGDLEEDYNDSRNHLNIITTQGSSFNVQKVLSKKLFKLLRDTHGFPFEPEVCFVPEPAKINGTPGTEVWNILYKQIKDEEEKLQSDHQTVFRWYFEKLHSNEAGLEGKRHVILWLSFELGGEDALGRIVDFCQEFTNLFMQEFTQLGHQAKKTLGKMFLFISDERKSNTGLHKELFKDCPYLNEFNLILTETISNINKNHAKGWIDSFTTSTSDKIEELRKDVWSKLADSNESQYGYEDFVNRICRHCQFSKDQVMLLDSYLYDFNNQTLI